jgi:GDP-D-mannose dehydratase
MNQRFAVITGVTGQDSPYLGERLPAVELPTMVAEMVHAGHG